MNQILLGFIIGAIFTAVLFTFRHVISTLALKEINAAKTEAAVLVAEAGAKIFHPAAVPTPTTVPPAAVVVSEPVAIAPDSQAPAPNAPAA